MPERSRKIYGTYTIRISKVVAAPTRYVFDWLTDYRTDDGKFSESRPRFRVIRLSRDRVVRIRTSHAKAKVRSVALELVRLNPPNSWHVDQIDEGDLAAVDYAVSRIGPRRSRVTLDITERWMIRGFPSRGAYQASTGEYWDRLVAALEARFQSGSPARG